MPNDGPDERRGGSFGRAFHLQGNCADRYCAGLDKVPGPVYLMMGVGNKGLMQGVQRSSECGKGMLPVYGGPGSEKNVSDALIVVSPGNCKGDLPQREAVPKVFRFTTK